eukprot:10156349-Lingulodinium_polyedra.AAC.1
MPSWRARSRTPSTAAVSSAGHARLERREELQPQLDRLRPRSPRIDALVESLQWRVTGAVRPRTSICRRCAPS